MPDLDVAELTSNLEKITANLNRHIDQEANRRAAERGKVYAKAADERIQDNAVELQRAQDLAAELRRQLNVAARHSAAYVALGKALRQAGVVPDRRDGTVPVSVLLDCIDAGVRADRAEWDRQRQVKSDAAG